MCVYSQAHRIDAIHPPCTARWNPQRRPPIDRVQVERPGSPSGASPVSEQASIVRCDVPRSVTQGSGGGRRPTGPTPASATSDESSPDGGDRLPYSAGREWRRVLRPRPDAAGRRVRARRSPPPCGRPGSRRAAIPGERFVYGLFNRIGETLPSMALARQAATLAKGRSRAAHAGRRRGRRRRAGGDGPAVRRAALRPAPRRRAPDRAGHDDALRPRQAAGRPPRPRRRRRHPLRRQRRRHLRRHARRARSCGRPASWRPCGRGPPSTASTSRESYAYSDSFYDTPLLERRRHPDRRQPRPADGADGDDAALADPQPRRLAGRGQDPGARHRAAAPGAAVRPARR